MFGGGEGLADCGDVIVLIHDRSLDLDALTHPAGCPAGCFGRLTC
jgi:hypothetical protein